MEERYFRSGLGLKAEARQLIDAEFQSSLVRRIRARGNTEVFGDITFQLAKEFGFCYGVDRAVEYAYETHLKFPHKRIYLIGEIIHNPHVNQRIREMGIESIFPESDGHFSFDHIRTDDVVIIPAFGLALNDFVRLRDIGCVLIDTTCGSVLLVWKRVEGYARDGYTALIHGKHTHEECRATASQVNRCPDSKYITVRNMDEARLICDFIAKRSGHLDREALSLHFRAKASVDFDPDRDLQKIGVANQTTMLAEDSLAIGGEIRRAFVEAHGETSIDDHFRSFGTICSATQERQDAVGEMMKDPPDLMIVIGGYNSSNTNNLAHLCRDHTRTFHIEAATCIDVESGTIRHKPESSPDAPEVEVEDWLPAGPFQLGLSAGASTPNNKIGEVILRVLNIRGIPLPVEIAGDGGSEK